MVKVLSEFGNIIAPPTIQDIGDKADKVNGAIAGHLAGLDANGNLTDSGTGPLEQYQVTITTSAWSLVSGSYVANIYPASGKIFNADSLVFVALDPEHTDDELIDFASQNKLRPIEITSAGALKMSVNEEPEEAIYLNIAASLVTASA